MRYTTTTTTTVLQAVTKMSLQPNDRYDVPISSSAFNPWQSPRVSPGEREEKGKKTAREKVYPSPLPRFHSLFTPSTYPQYLGD